MKKLTFLFAIIIICFQTYPQNKTIALSPPVKTGGMPLMDALNSRSSTREFADKAIAEQTLSNLLWAAWGINRPDGNKHTAPSSNNKQEMEIYVVKADGAYKFIPAGHSLELISTDDIRSNCGTQDYVSTAPLNLIYVSDLTKIDQSDYTVEPVASYANTGFMAQNVYLFCASEGLGAVTRGSIDKDALAGKLKLKPSQKIILGQTIGYPK